ncbi:metallophosphoesterase family protein [Desulfoprunum benzoelyticum]|nr:metallophosphoesterase family protein [Desulfoprunum benzoelyticum]MBM9529953.1 metallophosphoesterase family protein [Desulfoprunum benzoelyticum]
MLNILLLSDIHGNFPALAAIEKFFAGEHFDLILNCGDSVVYAPFPSETLRWLKQHQAISILGNTDKKVNRLLLGKSINKPRNIDKRIMYTSTVSQLDEPGRRDLLAMPIFLDLHLAVGDDAAIVRTAGLHHGSPAEPHEFLFADTPNERFVELAAVSRTEIIITGHSHTPYHKQIAGIHFINPGSAGRMFDGDPRVSCAILRLSADSIEVEHFRIAYDIEAVVRALSDCRLPGIYARMYREGRKLN